MAKSRHIISGVFVGLAAGFAAGILLAPRSGKDTRNDIRRKGQSALDDLVANVTQMGDELIGRIEKLEHAAGEMGDEYKADTQELMHRAEALKQDLQSSAINLAKSVGASKAQAMISAKRLVIEGNGVMEELEKATKKLLQHGLQKVREGIK